MEERSDPISTNVQERAHHPDRRLDLRKFKSTTLPPAPKTAWKEEEKSQELSARDVRWNQRRDEYNSRMKEQKEPLLSHSSTRNLSRSVSSIPTATTNRSHSKETTQRHPSARRYDFISGQWR